MSDQEQCSSERPRETCYSLAFSRVFQRVRTFRVAPSVPSGRSEKIYVERFHSLLVKARGGAWKRPLAAGAILY